jgi:hypothetical protein
MNEVSGRFRVLPEFGVPRQEILREGALALPPPLDHFLDQLRRQHFCRFPGQRGRLHLI